MASIAMYVLKSRLYKVSFTFEYKENSKLLLRLKPGFKLACKSGMLHLFLVEQKAQKCNLLISLLN